MIGGAAAGGIGYLGHRLQGRGDPAAITAVPPKPAAAVAAPPDLPAGAVAAPLAPPSPPDLPAGAVAAPLAPPSTTSPTATALGDAAQSVTDTARRIPGFLSDHWKPIAGAGVGALGLYGLYNYLNRKKEDEEKVAAAIREPFVAGFLLKCAESRLSDSELAETITRACAIPCFRDAFAAVGIHPGKEALYGNARTGATFLQNG